MVELSAARFRAVGDPTRRCRWVDDTLVALTGLLTPTTVAAHR